ncbi:MAG: galactose oxidase [Thermomicrobiales bacterium]|nr:galactose oxidase [Thermomicrobiales bacterium]
MPNAHGSMRFTRRSALATALVTGFALPRVVRAEATPVAAGWETVAGLALPRSEYAAAVLGDAIYVAGGFGAESSFDRYDPAADAWERLADLPAPRHHLTLIALDEALYIAGGLNIKANSAEATFWRYDPAADRWDDLEPLPQGARGSLGGGAIDGRLYIAGGSAHDLSGPATNDLAVYDPEDDRWELLTPMPTAREHLGVGVANGFLVAVGGRDGGHESPAMLEATEIYDPATGTWSAGVPMPTPRAGLGVASDGESIFVLGGERFSNGAPVTLAAVERYEPEGDRWTSLPDLPVGRHGIAAAWLEGALYAIGGSVSAGVIENIRSVDRMGIRNPG